jgi:23S rRNA pseudouridine1911/1915/1917 synthase
MDRRHRLYIVPEDARGMRLDRYLTRRFVGYSRSALSRGIRGGLVTTDEDDAPLRASTTLRGGERLRLYLPGIAPGMDPPSFPPILYEDDRVIAIDKPAGLLTHPSGTDFAWAVVSLAKTRWPGVPIDLVHRIDRDTSGVLLLTKDLEANRRLKECLHDGGAVKEYEALCKGRASWDEAVFDGPIGPAETVIRIQMAVREGGLEARTEARVVGRSTLHGPALTRVRCRIYTGRTHQIRVHLHHAGLPILGDRLYGVPPEVFLTAWEQGVDDHVIEAAGAPRHALHAARVVLPHPDGGEIDVRAPFPDDLARWWADPGRLPFDSETPADPARRHEQQ